MRKVTVFNPFSRAFFLIIVLVGFTLGRLEVHHRPKRHPERHGLRVMQVSIAGRLVRWFPLFSLILQYEHIDD